MSDLVDNKRKNNQSIRIVDLDCGVGQGYGILTKIDRHNLDLSR
ncbi:MAG: hypothetical protein ACQZ3M_03975 [cyanobacterium endosymbiont of Rhopalodia fuxianensis]